MSIPIPIEKAISDCDFLASPQKTKLIEVMEKIDGIETMVNPEDFLDMVFKRLLGFGFEDLDVNEQLTVKNVIKDYVEV